MRPKFNISLIAQIAATLSQNALARFGAFDLVRKDAEDLAVYARVALADSSSLIAARAALGTARRTCNGAQKTVRAQVVGFAFTLRGLAHADESRFLGFREACFAAGSASPFRTGRQRLCSRLALLKTLMESERALLEEGGLVGQADRCLAAMDAFEAANGALCAARYEVGRLQAAVAQDRSSLYDSLDRLDLDIHRVAPADWDDWRSPFTSLVVAQKAEATRRRNERSRLATPAPETT